MTLTARTVELQEVVRFASGGTPSKGNPANWGGDVPWVSAKDLKVLNLHDSQDHLTKLGAKGTNLAPEGSVLVLVRGMTLLKDLPVGVTMRPMAFNQDVKALYCTDGLRPYYLAYYLISRKQEILQSVETAGHGTGRLDTDFLKTFPIELPCLDKQDDIIKVIGEWDTAIEKAAALLAALEQRQQGLLQQLLTGRRRLKGFKGKWKEVTLGNVLERITRKNSDSCNNALTVSAQRGLVAQGSYFAKQIAAEANEHYVLLNRGEFAYNRSAANGYPFGAIKRLDSHEEGIVSTLCLCFGIRGKDVLDSDFLVWLIEAGRLNRAICKIAHEGARSHGLLNVTAKDFFGIKTTVPGFPEQRAIAAILNDTKMEIDALRGQVEALKVQKRALMQKLLSGNWHMPKTALLKEFST